MESHYSILPQEDEQSSYTATESESECLSEKGDEGLVDQKEPMIESTSARIKQYLTSTNWRNVLAAACLWIAFMLCSAAFSIIGPFFPEEVCSL